MGSFLCSNRDLSSEVSGVIVDRTSRSLDWGNCEKEKHPVYSNSMQIERNAVVQKFAEEK